MSPHGIVKWHFSNIEKDDRGVFETRGFACEIVAWRFLTHLSKHELIDYLLRELQPILPVSDSSSEADEAFISRPLSARMASNDDINERSRLLYEDRTTPNKRPKIREPDREDGSRTWSSRMSESTDHDPTLSFVGLNALEIATVAGAKRFLSQRVVQDVINGIWAGDIIFWESMSTHTRKRAQMYHPRKADLFCRLRVPQYQKAFEAAFFAIFLILYYAVLVERNPRHITVVEVLLYIWISAFAYDEFGEFTDAGTLFYAADFWSLWDVGIVGIGVAYLILRESRRTGIVTVPAGPWLALLKNTPGRSESGHLGRTRLRSDQANYADENPVTLGIIGLSRHSNHIINISFDILSLEALFLVPRVCSLLSLNTYFGTLVGKPG
ncbi:MAG: hypothetical protein LQ343_003843 [Gyalolechia ehrenbergii]|nr:MAG: hypothetical protein LQ343_003843 [Gyalolechia ehrenbergii]